MIEADGNKRIYVSHVTIRQSIFFMLLRLIFLDIIAALFVIAYFSPILFPYFSEQTKLFILSANVFYFLTLLLAKFLLTLYIISAWLNDYYEIAPDKIIHRSGILWRRIDEDSLDHVRSVGIKQGLFGRLFNFGTIRFFDWDLRKYNYLYQIHNPNKYIHVLEDLLPEVNREREIIREKVKDDELE